MTFKEFKLRLETIDVPEDTPVCFWNFDRMDWSPATPYKISEGGKIIIGIE